MVIFIFSFLVGNFSQNIKIVCSNLKYFKYVEFNGDFFFSVRKYPFWIKFLQKSKIARATNAKT